MLQAALAVRMRYMDLSLQNYCNTTRQMLEGKQPPSSMFCSMSSQELATKYTTAGDVMNEWCELQTSTSTVNESDTVG